MTEERLKEVLALPPEEGVKALQKSDFKVPQWKDLEKQYNAMKHDIMDLVKYPAKENENGVDDFKRTPLSLQKLAANRLAQAMFGTPVHRIWRYDPKSPKEVEAKELIEELYRVKNNIDSENIERGKKNNSACEIVTVWSAREREMVIGEQKSSLTLIHKTYSAKDGYRIYAQIDDYDEIIVISLGYEEDTDEGTIEYLDVYANYTDNAVFKRYVKQDKWEEDKAPESTKELPIFPCVHTYLEEPVWGGDAGTLLVHRLEEMESYQGLYIVRNALPTFTIDWGEVTGDNPSSTSETSNDSRRLIVVGKGGKMDDVTWEGADKAVTNSYNRIRNAFFEQIQIPDLSFANLINSNTSAENKELLFTDGKARAVDLGGEWNKFFSQELDIVLAFASVMFSSYRAEFEKMSARSVITPYSVKSKQENADYVSTAGQAMSTKTQVAILGEVDDVDQEVELIGQERSAEVNQGLG